MTTATKKRPKPKTVSAKWRKLLSLVPGYDPFADAAECWFDDVAAQKALDFFPECCRHVEGAQAGQAFILEPWEQSIIANLFGWKRKDVQGREIRRYRECLIYVPRKNGKTPFIAALGLYIFFCDDERGQQGYIAAGEREQAGALFRHAKGMVQQEPELQSRCRIYGGNAAAGQSKSLVREEDGSFLRVIAADADTQHGGNTHFAAIDELHVQPNRDLVDVFRTSMSSQNRKQPLLVYITTADFSRESICNEVYARACKVRDGIIQDQAFLPVIFEAHRDDDWTSEEVWAKANPNLGVSKSLDYMRRECKLAQENPAQENTFKRLDLNIKTEQDCRVIKMDQWERCGYGAEPVEWRERMLRELIGKPCAGGIDLGSVSDLTALALLFGDDESGYDVLPFFWTPEDNAHKRERKDSVPYLAWARQGFITMTEGDETDYGVVRRDILGLSKKYIIEVIAADRLFQGAQICQDLGKEGFNLFAFGQGYASMAAPTRRILELIHAGMLRHGNNPVLKWMASNAATESDGEILKFSKKRSQEKIDGIIATTMALGVLVASEGEYDHSFDRSQNSTDDAEEFDNSYERTR
ncbi:MAG: terminase large subunit [Planctomycetales bacterium]